MNYISISCFLIGAATGSGIVAFAQWVYCKNKKTLEDYAWENANLQNENDTLRETMKNLDSQICELNKNEMFLKSRHALQLKEWAERFAGCVSAYEKTINFFEGKLLDEKYKKRKPTRAGR